MSPLLFLAIPLVVFAVGSTLLYLGSRFRGSSARLRKAPADLRTVAPMLRDQRESGWPVNAGQRNGQSSGFGPVKPYEGSLFGESMQSGAGSARSGSRR